VEVAIRRSRNLWNFHTLDDKDHGKPMGASSQKLNQTSNIIGLPAVFPAGNSNAWSLVTTDSNP